MFGYPDDTFDAALVSSFILIGKKDNISTNYLCASSLLEHEDKYNEVREELLRKSSTVVPILDEWHKNNK